MTRYVVIHNPTGYRWAIAYSSNNEAAAVEHMNAIPGSILVDTKTRKAV